MGKTMKKILCTLLVVVMCLTSAPLSGFELKASAKTITSYKQGDIIEFGWYPQSKVTDESIISALNSVGSEWISYNYYSGTGDCSDGKMTASDYMRYKDVIYAGNKYRGVVFDSYRPYFTGYTSSTSYQDDNGYYTGTTYWFKYEPIKWRVLDPATGLVMSVTILDSQAYNNYFLGDGTYVYWGDLSKTYYANYYEKSSIRQWLNNGFYNTAFSKAQQNIIKSTTIDNSGYDSGTTIDKIYLLSYNDLFNTSYGFKNNNTYGSGRIAYGSDYAKCQGLDPWDYSASWLLRSPSYLSYCYRVTHEGLVGGGCTTYLITGIRPALNFNLTSEIFQSDAEYIGNDGTGDKTQKEEPRDFSDYEVESGKLEEVIYGVDSNGNECITEVVLNGKKYNIKSDTETFIGLSDNSIQNELNKNVAVAVLDGEIVMLLPVGSLSKDDITSHIQDDIGLYCGYGEMYSEEDYNRGFRWSEPDENNIIYAIYEAFNPNKELHLSTYLIQKDFYVMPTHQEFDYELKEYLESQIPETQVHIDKIQLKLRNTNAISFDGKDTYTINVNADIKSNQTLDNSIPIKVKSEYEIPEDKSVELVLFDIIITGERNGEKVEFTNTENIKIKNCDYVEPVKDKNNNKPTKKQYAKDAAAKLDGLTGAITLTGLLGLFSSEELEYIGNVILAEIAMAETPKDTLKQYLSTKVIDSLFNIDSSFIKLAEDEIEFTVAGDTKYGEIKLKLICKYSKVYFSGSEFCFTGSVDYEVIGGKGASKLPSSYKNGGLAGMFSSVDMQSFCESAYKLFECHLQKGVDQVWGNDVDGAADLIFGTIVNEILAETELESVSNIAFEIMAKPGKSVLINCPVDVYVYNADNELVAAVVGNEVIQADEKAQISVNGDVKKVILLDDSYSIVYRAIADGEMKITVEEYGTSGGLLNSSTISEIPLIAGRKYTQSIDNDFMEESEYTVTSASGNDYVPDKGYSTLAGHDYISGIIKEVTCQEHGKLINTCSKCGDTYTETIPATGHTFDGSKCTSCGYDKADECDCNCHASGIKKFFFNFILFFQKLFKKNAVCACGVAHY